MKRVSFLTVLILLTIFPMAGKTANATSDSDFAKLESEYAAAKQEFADEVKKQKNLEPSELHTLREKIVGPKKQALDEAYSKRANARRIDPKEMGASAPKENPLTGGIPGDSAPRPLEESSAPLPSRDIPTEIRYPKKSNSNEAQGTLDAPTQSPTLGAGVSEIRYPKTQTSPKVTAK